ncbi:MAG: pyruvate synthase subunit PorD [Candidatus Altiarchaeota archaeon]
MTEFEKIKINVNEKEITLAGILESNGSTVITKTGAWRAYRPVFDFDKCISCGLCWVFCPEGCIFKKNNGKFDANLDYCKGCGICANECPKKAITMIKEKK